MRRILELDGLRGVAVSLVVLGHAATTLPGALAELAQPIFGVLAATGVKVFFVLSGFLITSILLEEKSRTGNINLANFYLRRARRIFPAFYVYLAAIFVLATFGIVSVSASQFASAGLHVWNYSHLSATSRPIDGELLLGHFWTLSLEEQFYWVWPVMMLAAGLRARWIILAVIITVPFIRLLTYHFAPSMRGQLSMMFQTGVDTIAMGAAAALYRSDIEVWLKRRPSQAALLWTVVGAILLLPMSGLVLGGWWKLTVGIPIEAACCGLLVILLATSADHTVARALRSPALQWLGLISFSLYLWQQVFCLAGTPTTLPFYLAVPAALAAAALSFYLVESQFLQRRISSNVSAKA